jgi:F420H(2)-dependent quinone reductase
MIPSHHPRLDPHPNSHRDYHPDSHLDYHPDSHLDFRPDSRLDERRAGYQARKAHLAAVRAELAERRRHGLVLRHAQKLRNLAAARDPVPALLTPRHHGGHPDMSTTSQPQDSPVSWVNDHIRRYVESNGADGHDWRGAPTLLLTTTGRRSGIQRRTALIYREVAANTWWSPQEVAHQHTQRGTST